MLCQALNNDHQCEFVFSPPMYFACGLHACYSHIPVACFVISSHTLMSQFSGTGPIRLSNLLNLALFLSPLSLKLLEISPIRCLCNGRAGRTRWRRLCGSRWGGGDGRSGESYRPFDIIMAHYISVSSLCVAAKSTRGQSTEASVL